MFAEAEKQNEEIKRLKRENEGENVGGMNCLSKEMAQMACLKRVKKGKLFEKDVDSEV